MCLLLLSHYLFDFVFVTPSMLKSKATGSGCGILTHSLSHTVSMMMILLFWGVSRSDVVLLGLVQYDTHLVIDSVKCAIGVFWPCDSTTKRYWVTFGADQLLHQLVIVGMTWMATYPPR